MENSHKWKISMGILGKWISEKKKKKKKKKNIRRSKLLLLFYCCSVDLGMRTLNFLKN